MRQSIDTTALQMKIARRCALFIITFLITSVLYAQVISLDSVLRTIDRNNPMLREYESKMKALNEYSAGAKSWMAPMVGAGTFMTPYRRDPMAHEADKGSVMFSVEQQIPNPAKLNANKNYLQSRAGVEQQSRSVDFNRLRSEAKTYYYQWLVLEEKENLLLESQQIVELVLKLARIRYPYNQGSLGNIYKAEGRLSEVQNMIWMARGEREEIRSRLKSLMNLTYKDSIMVDTATVVAFDPKEILNDTSDLVSRRSDIKRINKTIESMRLNQRLQQSQAKPDFKIRFDHMQPIGDMPSQFTAMAMVSIPFAPWSSKMYKAESRGMNYDIEAMEREKESILLETRGMVTGMTSQLVRMKQQLANYKTKIIPALRRNYQTIMLAYEENREQLPMVIEGWESWNMAELDYLDKLQEYYVMIVKYESQLEK
jgi:outer membrane protein TolC